MKEQNPSLKTETMFRFPAIYPQDLLTLIIRYFRVIPSLSEDIIKF